MCVVQSAPLGFLVVCAGHVGPVVLAGTMAGVPPHGPSVVDQHVRVRYHGVRQRGVIKVEVKSESSSDREDDVTRQTWKRKQGYFEET